MPERDSILPERIGELEPVGGISVVRYKVITYKADLTPVVQYSSKGVFYEVKKALEWVLPFPGHLHQFKIPVAGARLMGSLNHDIESGVDILTLSTGERTGTGPKKVIKTYAVLTDNKDYFNIYVSIDTRKTLMFGGNVVWIGLPKESEGLTLNFSFNPGRHTIEELSDAIEIASKGVNSVVNMILDDSFGV